MHGGLISVYGCCLPGGWGPATHGMWGRAWGAAHKAELPQPVSGAKAHAWRQTSNSQLIFTGRRNPTWGALHVMPKSTPNLSQFEKSSRGQRQSPNSLTGDRARDAVLVATGKHGTLIFSVLVRILNGRNVSHVSGFHWIINHFSFIEFCQEYTPRA